MRVAAEHQLTFAIPRGRTGIEHATDALVSVLDGQRPASLTRGRRHLLARRAKPAEQHHLCPATDPRSDRLHSDLVLRGRGDLLRSKLGDSGTRYPQRLGFHHDSSKQRATTVVGTGRHASGPIAEEHDSWAAPDDHALPSEALRETLALMPASRGWRSTGGRNSD